MSRHEHECQPDVKLIQRHMRYREALRYTGWRGVYGLWRARVKMVVKRHKGEI